MLNDFLTGVILAGGKNSRFGRAKAQEVIDGQSMLERVIAAVSQVTENILIVASQEKTNSLLGGYPDQRIVEDIYPGTGVLGAIYTGLHHAATPCVLVVGCDMPFLNPHLLRYMAKVAQESRADAIVPVFNERFEVLHAIYSKSCIPRIQDLLAERILSVIRLLNRVKVRHINEEEIERFDRIYSSFINVNTQVDLLTARYTLRQLSGQGE
jgi:molybdopterin-guanine dinucleotide biosynthesis protein A